jgi:hypothetical protein
MVANDFAVPDGTRHASIEQTQRYLNVTDEELRRGLEVSWNNEGRPLRAVSAGPPPPRLRRSAEASCEGTLRTEIQAQAIISKPTWLGRILRRRGATTSTNGSTRPVELHGNPERLTNDFELTLDSGPQQRIAGVIGERLAAGELDQ